MENNETVKPQQGAWDDMIPSGERKPKVEFELNKPVDVMFTKDFAKPREFTSQSGGVFYIFECLHEGEERVIMTAAWSLLQGLKNAEPLAEKTLTITKVMKDGKQHYSVEDITDPDIPVEKIGDSEDDEVEDLDEGV